MSIALTPPGTWCLLKRSQKAPRSHQSLRERVRHRRGEGGHRERRKEIRESFGSSMVKFLMLCVEDQVKKTCLTSWYLQHQATGLDLGEQADDGSGRQ